MAKNWGPDSLCRQPMQGGCKAWPSHLLWHWQLLWFCEFGTGQARCQEYTLACYIACSLVCLCMLAFMQSCCMHSGCSCTEVDVSQTWSISTWITIWGREPFCSLHFMLQCTCVCVGVLQPRAAGQDVSQSKDAWKYNDRLHQTKVKVHASNAAHAVMMLQSCHVHSADGGDIVWAERAAAFGAPSSSKWAWARGNAPRDIRSLEASVQATKSVTKTAISLMLRQNAACSLVMKLLFWMFVSC